MAALGAFAFEDVEATTFFGHTKQFSESEFATTASFGGLIGSFWH